MKRILLLALLVGSSFALCGQRTIMVKKFTGMTRYSYQAGDEISLKTVAGHRLTGEITGFNDSLLYIGENHVIRLSDIHSIRREVYFPKLMSKLLLILGAGYLAIDATNNLINNQQVFDETTLAVSGAMIGVGLVLIPLSHRNLKIGERWRIYILDAPLPGP